MSHNAPPATTAGAKLLITTTNTTSSSYALQHNAALQGPSCFDENSPRPPVLGQEQDAMASCRFPLPSRSEASGAMSHFSPSFTPKKFSNPSSSLREASLFKLAGPMIYEPEGSEQTTPSSFVDMGTPPYLRWAISLASLLEDPEGVVLFKQYLEQEGSTDMLDFWFACEGLKNEARDDANVAQLVRLIHKRYFKAASPIKVNELLRKEVHRRVREVSKGEVPPDRKLFDEAQKQVEHFINDTAYPEFLRSETYLRHIRVMQSGMTGAAAMAAGSEEECSSSSSSNGKELTAPVGLLPTLHEESELEAPSLHHYHSPHHRHHHQGKPEAVMPLTRQFLMYTQEKRALQLRPKPEAYARLCLQKPKSSTTITPSSKSLPNPYHISSQSSVLMRGGLSYSSYNPVSRQDSELQSLSSDAYTSDSASVTNSSVDGSYYRSARKQHHLHSKQMRESASHNRDPHMHTTIIPRTQRIPRENLQPVKPDDFAKILIGKLEHVQKAIELQDKLERKLMEDQCGGEEMVASCDLASSRIFTETFQERLQVSDTVATPPQDRLNFTDDSNQAILDMHVSRVWSDLTPSRSPSLVSPRPRSPEIGRRRGNHPTAFSPIMGGVQSLQNSVHPSQTFMGPPARSFQGRLVHSNARHGRKDKDGVSTLSADSGNVHDYVESSDGKHYIPKSKSMPNYGDLQTVEPYAIQSHSSRMFSKESLSCKTGSLRKTLTDLSDSGVSVVSETPSCQIKDSRVMSWLIQNETKQVDSGAGYSHSDSSSKHRSRSGGVGASSGPTMQRQPALPPLNTGAWSNAPSQPFVADPSMPPLPSPNTATQLEEARRRLEDVKGKTVSRQRHMPSMSGKSLAQMSLPLSPSTELAGGSGHSTLKKHPPSSSTSTLSRAPSDYTIVMFTFCEEVVPYRTKISNMHVTLKQFKELLPKKGNYRYFFKTECDDVDTKVIHEEVMEDNEIVPLWDGKVIAQVKPVD